MKPLLPSDASSGATDWEAKYHDERRQNAQLVTLAGNLERRLHVLEEKYNALKDKDLSPRPLERRERPQSSLDLLHSLGDGERLRCLSIDCSCEHFAPKESAHWVCSGCGHLLLGHQRQHSIKKLTSLFPPPSTPVTTTIS